MGDSNSNVNEENGAEGGKISGTQEKEGSNNKVAPSAVGDGEGPVAASGGGGSIFRPSKLSSFGNRIEKTWAEEKKKDSISGTTKPSTIPIPSIFAKSKSPDSGDSNNPFKNGDTAKTSNSGGFIFGSKIRDRVIASGSKIADDNGAGGKEAEEVGFKNLSDKAGSTASFPDKEDASSSGSWAEKAAKFGTEATPIVDEVEVKTGEEDEINVFQGHCKLHVFSKDEKKWLERGQGILRINDKELPAKESSTQKTNKETRIVMRIQGSLRLVLNSKFWPEMHLERLTPKRIKISGVDPDSTEVHLFLISTGQSESETIERLVSARLEKLKASEKTSLEGTGNESTSGSRKRRGSEPSTPTSPTNKCEKSE